jgi:ABC-2 type transport system permease protein
MRGHAVDSTLWYEHQITHVADLGQLAWPLIIFLIIPMAMISSLVMNPDSPLTVTLSFFPMTNPIVIRVRLLVSTPAWWELLLCIGLLVAAILGIGALAARIFRVGILMPGKRPRLGEILRWGQDKVTMV